MLQIIDETNHAGIIPVHNGKDIHLRNATFIGFVLMETEISGLQSSAARERANVRNNRRITRGNGPEILVAKTIALLLNRRQRGANCFGTGNIGGHESVIALECNQFRLRSAICSGHLPVNAGQNDIKGYDNAEERANDYFGSLCHGSSWQNTARSEPSLPDRLRTGRSCGFLRELQCEKTHGNPPCLSETATFLGRFSLLWSTSIRDNLPQAEARYSQLARRPEGC